jgi:hypothetical protein
MEKAAAYAISTFIVGFSLWILIAGVSFSAPALWICTALITIFRPHIKSGAVAVAASSGSALQQK